MPGLQEAYLSLGQYINAKWSLFGFKNLDKNDKDKLLEMHNQLNTIFNQRGWLHQGGVIADYNAKKGKAIQDKTEPPPFPSQQELIDEAIKADSATRQFTRQILLKIKQTLEIFKDRQPPIPNHLATLLDDIRSGVDRTIQRVDNPPLTVQNLLNRFPIMMAKELKVPFVLSVQSADPLSESQGSCYGHTMMWCRSITSNPIPVAASLYRLNVDSYRYQREHEDLFVSKVRKIKLEVESVFSNKKPEVQTASTIRSEVQNIISKISPKDIYCIGLLSYDQIKEKPVGHAMGIRKLSPEGYEFFDPNYGTFIFKNAFQLEVWLVNLMRNYTYNNVRDFSLNLYLIGQQADHSVASIPTLRQDEEKVSEPKSSLSSRLSSATDNEKVYFLLQHANSLSNTQMDEASAEQIILYQNFKKATDENYLKQAIELESKELKDAVILKIETKIESLKKQKTPYEISKQTQSLEELDLYYKNEKINKEITLLTNLKTQIFNAAPTQNLFTTVNLWLETNKLDDNNKLKSFINDLEEKNEMSPYFLNYMRASVLLQLKHMFLDRSWDSLSKQSPEIELLKKAILNFEDNQSTFKDLLLKLKKIVSEVHLDKAKHVDLMQFYTCLSDINPYDGHRLRLTVKKLFNFDHEFIMQKVLVPTVETPPPAITSTQNEQDNTAKQQGQDIVVKIHFGK